MRTSLPLFCALALFASLSLEAALPCGDCWLPFAAVLVTVVILFVLPSIWETFSERSARDKSALGEQGGPL